MNIFCLISIKQIIYLAYNECEKFFQLFELINGITYQILVAVILVVYINAFYNYG